MINMDLEKMIKNMKNIAYEKYEQNVKHNNRKLNIKIKKRPELKKDDKDDDR